MSPVDIFIIVVLLISTVIGVVQGFIREILSLLSWLIALCIAWSLAETGAEYLPPYIEQAPLRVVAAFTVILIIALIVVSILNNLLYKSLSIGNISVVDRLFGLVFGMTRGAIIISILIIASSYMGLPDQPWWWQAKLVAYFTPINNVILFIMPADIVQNFLPQVN